MALCASAILVGLALAAAGSAATSCWQQVLDEWSAGHIKAHPLACYEQAIDNAPADITMYSSFPDDVQTAIQSAVATRARRSSTHGRALAAVRDVPVAGNSIGVPLAIEGFGAVLLAGCVLFGTQAVLRRRTAP
jgi:hypothetical protein